MAFLSPAWPPGQHPNGIASYVGTLREGLTGMGLETRVLSPRVQGMARDSHIIDLTQGPWARSWMARARSMALGVAADWAMPYDMSLRLRAALRELHRRWPFGVFEAEESFGFAATGRPPRDTGVIVRLHGPWFLNGAALGISPSPLFRWRELLERRAIERATAVTSPSKDVLERVRAHYGLPLRHATVIPNPSPRVSERDRWTLQGCQPQQILFVGRFDRHKGGDVMLDAFIQVGRRFPQAQLLFVGPDRGFRNGAGRTMGVAEYLAERVPAEVRSRVYVLGAQPREAIAALRRQAFVTVVPSRYETFSMTVVEAMAFGSPLVAAAAGAIPELVRHGRNALVFPPGDASALATELHRLLEDPQLAARLGAQAARDAVERFAIDVVAKQSAALYAAVFDRVQSLGHRQQHELRN